MRSVHRVVRHCVRVGLISCLLAGAISAGGVSSAHPVSAASTLRIWYGSDDPTEQSWTQTLVKQFMTQHPGITVQFSFYGLDDMNDKTQLALNTATPPDLIYSTPRGPGLPAYIHAGKLLDLSAQARSRGWAAQLRPGLLSSYNTLLDGNGTQGDAGKAYAIPYLLAADGLLYNKDIFNSLHLQLPRTQTQFLALLPQIKRAGYTPLGFGNQDAWTGDAWYLTLLNAAVGPAALQPALKLAPSFSFTATPFQHAAMTLQNWAKDGYFTSHFAGLDPQDAVENFFEQGRTAMQLISSTEASQILSSARNDGSKAAHVGFFAFPAVQVGKAPVIVQDGYSGWAIPRASKNQTAALQFIDSAVSSSTTQTLLAQGLIPAHRLNAMTVTTAAPFQHDFLIALAGATPGIYLDAVPIPNFLATMEAQLQQFLANKESPASLTQALQVAYNTHGSKTQYTDTDGEF